MSYQLILSKPALKTLRSLPTDRLKRVHAALDHLKEEARPSGCKKLKGLKEDLWRIRVGDLRILYTIDDAIRIIDVRRIADRKDAYKA